MLFRKKSRFLILFSFYRKKRRLVSLRMRPPEAAEAADRAPGRQEMAARGGAGRRGGEEPRRQLWDLYNINRKHLCRTNKNV